MKSVAGKTVLVTGAAMGMGRLFVERAIAEHAAAVLLWDVNAEALAQTLAEVRMTLRNGEQLLLTLVIPLLVLVALSKLPADVVGHDPAIDAVAPGVLALAVMSTAFTGQAIATGFERRYGVLRLLGSTPLGRTGLLVAKTAAVLLEPIVAVEIHVPSDATSRINQIVTGHRGQLLGYDGRDGWPGWDTVKAHMPESEMASLIIELRSATSGVGTFTFTLDHMAELTGRAADQVVAGRKAEAA